MTAVSWNTLGNERALGALERAIVTRAAAHAYLFTGPESVGKGHAALEFAAALNCEAEVRPCRVCRSCIDTFAGRHPDVEVVAPGGICDESDHKDHADSRDLRICQVRRLERILSLTPYGGGRRIAIIEQADTLRTEAANAFLKTLEEPPEGTVLILLAAREDQLPDTILSRCQRIPFQRAPRETVVAALTERGADKSAATAIAGLAKGRVGWAIRALAEEALLDERGNALDDAIAVAHGGRQAGFRWARRAEDRTPAGREKYGRDLDVWRDWWRDLLSASAGAFEGITNTDREELLVEESKMYKQEDVTRFLRSLDETRVHLKENVDPQLALEVLVLDLPQPKSAVTGQGKLERTRPAAASRAAD